MNEKVILCYGDSNTWGWVPGTGARFPRNVRWPGILQQALGDGHYVIEEALNGRTTVWEDPIEQHKNGAAYLPACLDSHEPIDLAIVKLGGNDLKKRFSLSPYDIAQGIGTLHRLIEVSRAGYAAQAPSVLVVAPAPYTDILPKWKGMFEGAVDKSAQLAPLYEAVAAEHGAAFFNAGDVITPSPIDGVHYSAEAHRTLGEKLADVVRNLLLTSNEF